MILSLIAHPTTPCPAVTALTVEAVRDGVRLALTYRLTGQIDALELPERTTPVRTDGLWRRTCFEAFVQPVGEAGYSEFNLAPSGAWAAYRFGGRRTGMADLAQAPEIHVDADGGSLILRAAVTPPVAGSWRVGLAAVIETRRQGLSYWALQNFGDAPDFHNPDGFVLTV